MTRRIYIITPKDVPANELEPTDVRLVRAESQAAAWKHLADEYAVAYAEQDALATWSRAGVSVEDAGAKPANPSN